MTELADLSKEQLVALHKALTGSTGDYARLGKAHYLTVLATLETTKVQRGIDSLPQKSRKPHGTREALGKALADNVELTAFVRAFIQFDSNPNPHAMAYSRLVERAKKLI